MKLKKIVSLALAGVLAVSMLAGCKNDGSSNSGSSSSEQTTATGYSSKLADKMKDLADEDYISFADNASDEAALDAAVAGLANRDIFNVIKMDASQVTGDLWYLTDDSEVWKDFMDNADVNDKITGEDMFESADYKNGTYKIGIVYAVDGSVSMDKVMELIAENLDQNDRMTKGLEEEITGADAKYNCSYVVSVSVVNVANETFLDYDYSANFISVTITRTAVDV